jgi:hypothetical protein
VIDLFVSVYTIIIARRKEANRINFLWGCGEKTKQKKKKKNEAMIGGGLMMRLLPRSWNDGNNSVAQKFGGVGGWLLAGCGS